MSAPQFTLAQLLATQGLDEIRARYLAGLQGAGFPALTQWVPKDGVEMSHVAQVASFLTNDIAADLPGMIASGFLGEGAGRYLDLLGESVFLLQRNPASSTTMNWTLACVAGAGPYVLRPGDVQLVAETANAYVSTSGGTLQSGKTLTLAFQAAEPGASYNDVPTEIGFDLSTTLAGVTLQVPTDGSARVQGGDAESDAAFGARCTLRWSTISRNPTRGLLLFWALRAVPQATRLALGVDPIVPGRAVAIAADSAGPLDASALAMMAAYVTTRLSSLESFGAVGAAPVTIDATGSILVAAANLVAVQRAAQIAWVAFLGTVPIGGAVHIFDLVAIAVEAGAIDAGGIQLNGLALDVILPAGAIPVPARSIIDSLTWTPQ